MDNTSIACSICGDVILEVTTHEYGSLTRREYHLNEMVCKRTYQAILSQEQFFESRVVFFKGRVGYRDTGNDHWCPASYGVQEIFRRWLGKKVTE